MGVNSLPKTVTRQRRGCDLNPGPSALESSTLNSRLPSHPEGNTYLNFLKTQQDRSREASASKISSLRRSVSTEHRLETDARTKTDNGP